MPRSLASPFVAAALMLAPAAACADATADLHALFDREWERDFAENPIAATYLGDKVDIHAFHDTVLATGAMPLDILERNIDGWIVAHKGK